MARTMVETDTRLDDGQYMPTIHGEVRLMDQNRFTAGRHRLPTDLTRSLMLSRGPSIGINRDSADAFNDLLEIQLHCLYLLLRPEPRRPARSMPADIQLFAELPTDNVRSGWAGLNLVIHLDSMDSDVENGIIGPIVRDLYSSEHFWEVQ